MKDMNVLIVSGVLAGVGAASYMMGYKKCYKRNQELMEPVNTQIKELILKYSDIDNYSEEES